MPNSMPIKVTPIFKGTCLPLIILALSCMANVACAQEPSPQDVYMDKPTDTLALRRESFKGIGPVPYHLPPKKTQEQLLEDRYALMKDDAEVLQRYFRELGLYRQLEDCGNSPLISRSSLFSQKDSINAENSLEKSLLASINFYQQLDNRLGMSDIQNKLALYYAKEAEYNKAISYFRKALYEKELLNDHNAQKIIIRNLAYVHQFIAAYPEATTYFEQVAQIAIKERNLNLQAEALAHLAQIKAKGNRFLEAQNDVIKKVMPLYRRTKNDAGRIEAFQTLASFYLDEKKFTQSRWFYLQAIEIASLRNHYQGIATSLYELASVKSQIAEYPLAVIDYKAAEGFARQSKDRELLLKINSGLSNAYMALGDHGSAAQCISQYYSLKKELLGEVRQKLLVDHLQKTTLIAQEEL